TQKDILNLCSVFISSIIGIFALSFIRISFQIHVNSIVGVILVIGVVLFTISMLFSPVIFVSKLLAFRNHGMIKRTKKGEELLEQIYGLKNFLKDFSIIDDRKFEDVYLQEHYLVYAITLEVNTKVDDEILKKIKKQIKG
ncbi:MAG: DUF2207 domain-containing protein, partial [Bacilli bacterium]|nr:DUF2207 domain-containing protein [Bacilli bacterium]